MKTTLSVFAFLLIPCTIFGYQTIIENNEYGDWQANENQLINFELVSKTQLPETEELFFTSPRFINIDSEGNYYFYDRDQSVMASIAPNGTLRWITGQAGRGPGDFEQVADIKLINQTLIVSNVQGTRLDRFDLDGTFQSSTNLPGEASFVNIVGVGSDNQLVLSATLWGALGRKVFITQGVDKKFKVINSFELKQGDINVGQGMSSSASLTMYQNMIYSGHTTSYKIPVYDLESRLVSIISRDFNKLVRPGVFQSDAGSAIRVFGALSSPFFLNDGSFFINAFWPANVKDPDEYLKKSMSGDVPDIEMHHSIDYFDSKAKLMYSIEGIGWTPELGNFIKIDDENYLYTYTNEEPITIFKYKIIISE